MAFRLKAGESVKKAIPRLADRQVQETLEIVRDGRKAASERVHEVRTTIKKLRGLLRLLRPSLGSIYDRENARLRELAHGLSALRDAEVLVATFDDLWGAPGETTSVAPSRVRAKLTARLHAVQRHGDLEARLRNAARTLASLQLETWLPRERGWTAIAPGFADMYRRARRAGHAAYRASTDDCFHEWRKSVKYHLYHCKVLQPIWPTELHVRVTSLEQLGELLGDDHDAAVLGATLQTERATYDDEQDRRIVMKAIRRRQAALRASAQPLSAWLFAEKTGAFCRRHHAYYCVFRRGEAFIKAPPQATTSPHAVLSG